MFELGNAETRAIHVFQLGKAEMQAIVQLGN